MRGAVLGTVVLLALLFGCAGEERREVVQVGEMKLTSHAFAHNARMPSKYTCDGEDVNPQLDISGVPNGAKSLVLIMDDPDAPMGTWVHWVLLAIPPTTSRIAENNVPQGARQGTNDFGKLNYGGPCPPSGTHRYFFKLYALDANLSLGIGAEKADVEREMQEHILAQAELVGLYSKK